MYTFVNVLMGIAFVFITIQIVKKRNISSNIAHIKQIEYFKKITDESPTELPIALELGDKSMSFYRTNSVRGNTPYYRLDMETHSIVFFDENDEFVTMVSIPMDIVLRGVYKGKFYVYSSYEDHQSNSDWEYFKFLPVVIAPTKRSSDIIDYYRHGSYKSGTSIN